MVQWRDTLFFGLGSKLTDEQKDFLDAIYNYDIVFCNAKAGSGKTTLAVGAAKLLGKNLVYVFSPTQEKEMGFRPGSQMEKEKEYIIPLINALEEIGEVPHQVILSDELIEQANSPSKKGVKPQLDKVWVKPMSHVFARGINLKDCTVIIDEAQNLTKGEMKKILTRVHDSCKVIVIGHSEQVDIPKNKSGFVPYIEHFKNQDYAKICTLTQNFRGKVADWADEFSW